MHHLSQMKIIFNLSTLIHVLTPSVLANHFQCTVIRVTLGISQIRADDGKLPTVCVRISALLTPQTIRCSQ